MLVDAFGREVTDLRVSVTKRCNFGCIYCHDEGLGPIARPQSAHPEEMTVDEIDRLIRVAREFGIRSVKFTGGEPLVRDDLETIVARAVSHIPDVSLTTNGSMLASRAASLRSAGLKRVNVSVDALDAVAFHAIRKGSLPAVLRGIDAALACGLTPVKLNVVVFDRTLPHLPELVEHVRRHDGLRLQLIQFMPELVGQKDWAVDIHRVKEWLEGEADGVLIREMHHRSVYLFGATEVEVVDPVNNTDFCLHCHRVRVTHKGELKGCLNRNDDLIPTRGLDDDGLREAFRQVVARRVPYYGVYVPVNPQPPWAGADVVELPVLRSVPSGSVRGAAPATSDRR